MRLLWIEHSASRLMNRSELQSGALPSELKPLGIVFLVEIVHVMEIYISMWIRRVVGVEWVGGKEGVRAERACGWVLVCIYVDGYFEGIGGWLFGFGMGIGIIGCI